MSKNRMKTIVLLLVAPFFLYGATLKEYHPSGFNSNGKKIYGWSWLQKNGQYAEWTFTFPNAQAFTQGKVVLCFTALSTNKKGGGAGYGSTLKMRHSKGGRPLHIVLKNDCGCLKSYASAVSNSRGKGYMSHGCIQAYERASRINQHGRSGQWGFVIRVEYDGGNHTALKKDSVKLYIVK